MNQFQEMATYIAVVEAANISAAARRLGTTKSVVSRRIQQLETRLGTVLFERGKTLGLTDAGHLFYQRAVLILSEVSDAEESVRTLHGQLQGPLRLTAPMAFSIRYLAPLLSTFMAQYPSLNLDVEYSDRLANLNQENFDVAIRIGPLADSDLIAQRICANRHLICASPAYLAQKGTPMHPQHLQQHQGLLYIQREPTGMLQLPIEGEIRSFRIGKRLLPPPNRSRQSGWQRLIDRTRESLHMALKAMNAHRLRTALTMTGIIFGIAAVVTVVALGEGAKQRTLENLKDLGTNVVSIYPGRDFFDDAIDSIRTLVPADADALAQQSFVDSVSPEVDASDSIRFRSKSATASITGVGRDYFRVNGVELLQGVTFRDDRNALQEVIIDDNARQALFGDFGVEPLGQIVFLGSVPARVIGVAKSNRNYAPNRITVWMPYSTVMYRMVGKPTLSGITVRLKDNVASESAVTAITQLLTQRHGVKDFRLYNFDKIRKSIERTSMTFSLLILMVASIALVIGSLGVMNIMLVSVTERTHEIGVRMAVGARRSDIMQQFMIEAVLVCLIGGALGIALSFAAGSLFTSLAGGMFTAIYSWQAAATAFFCSTLIGMIFGYLPARKAARMDPVVSLASE